MAGLITDGTYALNTVNNHYNLNTTAPLTGDGSVDAPLGVNMPMMPGYETVLFSATNGSNDSTIQTVDNPWSYSKIGITYQNESTETNNYQGINYREYDLSTMQSMSGTPFITLDSLGMDGAGGTAYQLIRIANYRVDTTGLARYAANQTLNFGGRATIPIAKIYKVVGINHTANN